MSKSKERLQESRHFDYGDQESRRRKAHERLGSDHARCLICGVDDPVCLEEHHVAGRQYDEETVFLCKNDHAKISDAQKDHLAKLPGDASALERVGHWLCGLAELLAVGAEQLRDQQLQQLLSYCATELKEFGTTLIRMAANAPAYNKGEPL